MKIFFCASIRGKREKLYQGIVEILKSKARKVFTDHILKTEQKEMNTWTSTKRDLYHKGVLSNLRKSDIMVAEISYPSLSVGYLVALSVSWQKPTIVLFYGKEKPNILNSLESLGQLHVIEYENAEEMEELLSSEIDLVIKEEIDVRFTMLLPPKIVRFLSKTSKKRKIPRSVFIRNLIEGEMEKEK